MNKKNILVAIISGIVVITTSGVIMSKVKNSNIETDFESKVDKHIELNKNDSKVIAKVNEIEISSSELEKARIFRDDNLSDKELLEILITDIVLLNEAKSRGITIEKEAVEKFMNENKTLIEADNEAMKKIKSICEKLKISEEEYWNTIVFDGYYEKATIGAVKENIASDIKSKYNLENYDEIEKKIELEINEIKKDYKIERY